MQKPYYFRGPQISILLIFNTLIPVKLWLDVQYFHLSISSFYVPLQNGSSMRTEIFLFLFRSLLYVKCPADSKYSRYVFLNEGNTPFNTLERKAGKGDQLAIQTGYFASTEDCTQIALEEAGRHPEERREDYRESLWKIAEWLCTSSGVQPSPGSSYLRETAVLPPRDFCEKRLRLEHTHGASQSIHYC